MYSLGVKFKLWNQLHHMVEYGSLGCRRQFLLPEAHYTGGRNELHLLAERLFPHIYG